MEFLVNDVRIGVCFAVSFMTSSADPMSRLRGSKCYWKLGYNTSLYIRGFDRLTSVSGSKVMAKNSKYFRKFLGDFHDEFSFYFCHDFGTRNARKSVKPSYYSLVSNKNSGQKWLLALASRTWWRHPNVNKICINILPSCQHQQKNDIQNWNIFFYCKLQDFPIFKGFEHLSNSTAWRVVAEITQEDISPFAVLKTFQRDLKDRNTAIVALNLSNHNFPSDRARELLKPTTIFGVSRKSARFCLKKSENFWV